MVSNRPAGVSSRGFTLIELLVVVSIIMILTGMLAGGIMASRNSAKVRIAKADIASIELGLAAYRRTFGRYPPDNAVLGYDNATDPDGPHGVMNVCITYYLGTRLTKGLNTYGPFVDFKQDRLEDAGGGFHKYRDPFENLYLYAENESQNPAVGVKPQSYDMLTAGIDGELGGTMSPDTGYVSPTLSSDKALERDNITNWSESGGRTATD